MTLRGLAPEERELNPGQRCLDLYYQTPQRADPSPVTFDFTLKMVSQTLTLALIGAVTATALLVATLRNDDAGEESSPVRRWIRSR